MGFVLMGVFRLLPEYLLWWLIWLGAIGFIGTATTDPQNPWMPRVQAGLSGLFMGTICAVLFALLQNTFNDPRKRWLSWVFVVVTFVAVKLAFLFASGAFS